MSYVLYLEDSRTFRLFSGSFEKEIHSKVIDGLGVSEGMQEIRDQSPALVGVHG